MRASGGEIPRAGEPRILTIGHSNRRQEEFLHMLIAHGIELVVDVRKMPRSRTNPQFNGESLSAALAGAGIEYQHMPGLGGLRPRHKDSTNTGWRNASFRAFADYMQTDEFAEHLAELEQLGAAQSTVMMCAEAVPWRCHRSMIADALTVRGVLVLHIMTAAKANPHTLTAFAQVRDGRLSYPGPV